MSITSEINDKNNLTQWCDQGQLVSLLIASIPNDCELVLGKRERSALSELLDRLTTKMNGAN